MSSSMPNPSFRIGDPAVGPAVSSLQGNVIWIPNPQGFDSLLRVRGPVGRFLKDKAEQVKDMAQALAPVDTGALRDSIDVFYGKDDTNIYAEVGTDVYYGPFQELGTSRNPPHPYLRPALAAVMSAAVESPAFGGYVEDLGADYQGTEGRWEWDGDSRDWMEM